MFVSFCLSVNAPLKSKMPTTKKISRGRVIANSASWLASSRSHTHRFNHTRPAALTKLPRLDTHLCGCCQHDQLLIQRREREPRFKRILEINRNAAISAALGCQQLDRQLHASGTSATAVELLHIGTTGTNFRRRWRLHLLGIKI